MPHDIAIVHLVRKQNGIEPFKKFINSYKNYSAGIDHDLVLAFKGFQNEIEKNTYREILKSCAFMEIDVPDKGFDIGSYQYVFSMLAEEYGYFCFLNSYSEILCNDWLLLLHKAINHQTDKLAGCSASCGSLYNDRTFEYWKLDNSQDYPPFLVKTVLFLLRSFRWFFFPSAPNPHIRTNAFMISTEVLKQVHVPHIRNKIDAYRFESGRNSLTRQIQQMQYQPVVVGANGKIYNIENWFESNTFWRSNQQNLIIADNQTRYYEKSGFKTRAFLSYKAWQENAEPSLENNL
jgi:hypothetical protein